MPSPEPPDDPKALAKLLARLHEKNPEWRRMMRAHAPRVDAAFVHATVRPQGVLGLVVLSVALAIAACSHGHVRGLTLAVAALGAIPAVRWMNASIRLAVVVRRK
ncbi:MAG: hypothetical protein ACHREM_22540 [Polyangiales bacterium]